MSSKSYRVVNVGPDLVVVEPMAPLGVRLTTQIEGIDGYDYRETSLFLTREKARQLRDHLSAALDECGPEPPAHQFDQIRRPR